MTREKGESLEAYRKRVASERKSSEDRMDPQQLAEELEGHRITCEMRDESARKRQGQGEETDNKVDADRYVDGERVPLLVPLVEGCETGGGTGCRDIEPERIMRMIERWREAWPELQGTNTEQEYNRIYLECKKRVEGFF
jgi:hypothetical protein